MKQFGIPQPDWEYLPRPAAHAILFDGSSRLLAVKYRGKYFLPGGGVNPGESFEDALHREMAEEVGWTIRIGSKVGVAGEYVDVHEEGKHYNKIGHFFLGEIISATGFPIEADHEPKWLTIDEFAAGAAHQSHVWAVNVALALTSSPDTP